MLVPEYETLTFAYLLSIYMQHIYILAIKLQTYDD
jgi:hypothetical protein